jgi:hypothetical protein
VEPAGCGHTSKRVWGGRPGGTRGREDWWEAIVAEPEYDAGGVRIRRMLRSLTRAGHVLVRDGQLVLMTSYGSEIDSAPLDKVRISGYGMPDSALATISGTRYVLQFGLGRRAGLLNAVRTARAKAAAERGVLGT